MTQATRDHARELKTGERFAFGENWARFLNTFDENRLHSACASLEDMLGAGALAGRTWLDAGSGSGLFSLAAMRLGAARAHSFDFDPQSVACTRELARRQHPDGRRWTIEQGDALDADYVASLGSFDVVYSWGVLHHTGKMWRALEVVAGAVAPGGLLFLALYNDQGAESVRWLRIKRWYNRIPSWVRAPYVVAVMAPHEARSALGAARRGDPGAYLRLWRDYRRERGMSRWHDLVDWVGGYPFEVARPDSVIDRLESLGFSLRRMEPVDGWGCNQYVFARSSTAAKANRGSNAAEASASSGIGRTIG